MSLIGFTSDDSVCLHIEILSYLLILIVLNDCLNYVLLNIHLEKTNTARECSIQLIFLQSADSKINLRTLNKSPEHEL